MNIANFAHLTVKRNKNITFCIPCRMQISSVAKQFYYVVVFDDF